MNLGSVGVGPIGWAVIGVLLTVAAAAAQLARHPVASARRPALEAVVRFVPRRLDQAAARLRARLDVSTLALAAGAAGLLLIGALAVGFTAVLDDVLEGEGFAQLDNPAAHWLATHRELWLTRVLLALTRAGNADAQTLWLALVCAMAALAARTWAPVLIGAAGGLGISLVILVAKSLVGRQRPPLPYAVMPVQGFSFPSGHATGAAAVGLLSAWMLCHWVIHRWPAQVAVWTSTVVMIALIGFSRCYLGVHFVTDVLAGWLLGAGWAAAVILVASWWAGAKR